LHGGVKTTKAKAKALMPQAEKLISLAKKGTVSARRQALKVLTKRDLVKRLFAEIGPKFEERKSGFLRIINLGQRQGDGAQMARLEIVEESNRKGSSQGGTKNKRREKMKKIQ